MSVTLLAFRNKGIVPNLEFVDVGMTFQPCHPTMSTYTTVQYIARDETRSVGLLWKPALLRLLFTNGIFFSRFYVGRYIFF